VTSKFTGDCWTWVRRGFAEDVMLITPVSTPQPVQSPFVVVD